MKGDHYVEWLEKIIAVQENDLAAKDAIIADLETQILEMKKTMMEPDPMIEKLKDRLSDMAWANDKRQMGS